MHATRTTHESASKKLRNQKEVGERVQFGLVEDHGQDREGDRDEDQLQLACSAQRQREVDQSEHRRHENEGQEGDIAPRGRVRQRRVEAVIETERDGEHTEREGSRR